MAYLSGSGPKAGTARPSLPKKPSLPGKPVGLRTRPAPQEVAPARTPNQFDDDTNDTIVLWYKQHGNTGSDANSPTASTRTFHNPNSPSTSGADKPGKNYLFEALQQYGFDPQRALSAGVGAGVPRDASESRAKEITQQWKNYAAQTAPQNQNTATPQYAPSGNGQPPPLQATQSPKTDTTQPQPANHSNAIQDITNILQGFNEYVLGYPKSVVLNTLNQAQQLINGEPYSYDPKMTLADYTAATARRMGGTDASQFVAKKMAETYQSPQYKASLARMLGLSQDSQAVQWLSGLIAGSGNTALEGAADPINYFTGTAAAKALKGGSITAKMGTPAYEKALYSGKFKQDLPPLARTLDDEIRKAQSLGDGTPPMVADDVAKGYTGNIEEAIVGSKHDIIRPTQDAVNPIKVEEYIKRLRAGEQIPPIQVIDVPGRGQFIINGHHRYVASLRTGIPVEIKVTQSCGPIGMPDWSDVKWKEYINEEQFWGD